MEPQPSTPPDGPQRGAPWARRPGAGPEEDLYADSGTDERGGVHEDWSARYGAAPPPPPPPGGPDFSALFIVLDGLRRAAPAELQGRLTSFIREGLLTLRSLIDWYLDRLDRKSREPEVEDIPID
ncbi:MAG TPA: hypothetical protein VGV10_07630 [Thermoleophilaceae bacterium]|nr:hypothetical protein [Thermoleophilaceae bacterium]